MRAVRFGGGESEGGAVPEQSARCRVCRISLDLRAVDGEYECMDPAMCTARKRDTALAIAVARLLVDEDGER